MAYHDFGNFRVCVQERLLQHLGGLDLAKCRQAAPGTRATNLLVRVGESVSGHMAAVSIGDHTVDLEEWFCCCAKKKKEKKKRVASPTTLGKLGT